MKFIFFSISKLISALIYLPNFFYHRFNQHFSTSKKMSKSELLVLFHCTGFLRDKIILKKHLVLNFSDFQIQLPPLLLAPFRPPIGQHTTFKCKRNIRYKGFQSLNGTFDRPEHSKSLSFEFFSHCSNSLLSNRSKTNFEKNWFHRCKFVDNFNKQTSSSFAALESC